MKRGADYAVMALLGTGLLCLVAALYLLLAPLVQAADRQRPPLDLLPVWRVIACFDARCRSYALLDQNGPTDRIECMRLAGFVGELMGGKAARCDCKIDARAMAEARGL